jgi:hypothetical protein
MRNYITGFSSLRMAGSGCGVADVHHERQFRRISGLTL